MHKLERGIKHNRENGKRTSFMTTFHATLNVRDEVNKVRKLFRILGLRMRRYVAVDCGENGRTEVRQLTCSEISWQELPKYHLRTSKDKKTEN